MLYLGEQKSDCFGSRVVFGLRSAIWSIDLFYELYFYETLMCLEIEPESSIFRNTFLFSEWLEGKYYCI